MAEPISSPTFRHRLEHGLFRVLGGVLGRLPWSTLNALGKGLGAAFYWVDARHRGIALENLRDSDLGLSEAELRATVRASFRHFGSMFVSLLKLQRAEPEELEAWIRVEGLEHFDAVQAAGKGFIQLTGHYGHWEAVALIQSLKGRSLAVIGRELDNPLLERFSSDFRTRFGNQVILKGGAMRDTLKALKAGRGVGFLLDQDALTLGVWVQFLGRWASTFGTAGSLAVRYDLPVLPVFSWPNEDGTIQVRFEAPFQVPRTGDAEQDAWRATQLMTQCIDAQIRKDPRWWFWMHRRFKTQPGMGNPLPAPLPPREWIESLSTPIL